MENKQLISIEEFNLLLQNQIITSDEVIKCLSENVINNAALKQDEICTIRKGYTELMGILSQKKENITFFNCSPLFIIHSCVEKQKVNTILQQYYCGYADKIKGILQQKSSQPHFIFCLGNEGMSHTNLLVIYNQNIYSFDTVPMFLAEISKLVKTKRTFENSKNIQFGNNFFDFLYKNGCAGKIFLNCGEVFTKDQGSCIGQMIELQDSIERSALKVQSKKQMQSQVFCQDEFEKQLKCGMIEYGEYFRKMSSIMLPSSSINQRKQFFKANRQNQNQFLIGISQFEEHKSKKFSKTVEK